jgi:hypothetical protein
MILTRELLAARWLPICFELANTRILSFKSRQRAMLCQLSVCARRRLGKRLPGSYQRLHRGHQLCGTQWFSQAAMQLRTARRLFDLAQIGKAAEHYGLQP